MPRRHLAGTALLLLSALLFSLHNVLARLSYEHGVTPTTVAAARTDAVAIFLLIFLGLRGGWPRLPRAAWVAFAVTAFCYALHNPLLLEAFRLIPVSLAVLVMYLFPVLVALMAAAIGQEKLKTRTLVTAVVAFAGVVLVIGVGDAAPDWWGVLLAAVAAVALAGNLVGAAQLGPALGALGVPFALSCFGMIAFTGLMLADGGPVLPATAAGWALFAGATLTSPLALITFYLALPMVGAPQSALTMNVEPIITVLVAMVLLGETFGPYQALGSALIVGAVALAALLNMRDRPARARP